MPFPDRARRGVEVAGARVVPEALPLDEDLIDVRVRQVVESRESAEPAFEVRPGGLDPRLLEHDLGDPDAVRIGRLAPGQVSTVGVEEVEYADAHGRDDLVVHGAVDPVPIPASHEPRTIPLL